ncbi:MAG: hypothetical protein Alpg2KO_00450 [Alphaproteobacteria bacterium]
MPDGIADAPKRERKPAAMLKRMAVPLTLKADSDDGSIEGYGSVFGTVDSYREVVAPGAFEDSLKRWAAKNSLPKFLWQHDWRTPIGTWLEMREDERGLYVKGQLALGTQAGSESRELLKMGALDGLSIGFSPKKWEYDKETDILTLTEIDLWEVSLVTFPANQDATVESVRAAIRTGDPQMPDDVNFAKELQRQLDRHGDDLKSLEERLNTQLTELRGYAEEQSKKQADSVAEERMHKLSTDVAETQGRIEEKLKEMERRNERFEAFMERPRGGGSDGKQSDMVANAIEHRQAHLAIRGQMKPGMVITEKDVDVEAYADWEKQFHRCLRMAPDAFARTLDAKTFEVGSEPSGGFLIPPTISSRILSTVLETSPLRELATVERITTDSLEFPIDDDEIPTGWVGESDDREDSNTTEFGVLKIEVNEGYAQPKATQKFLDDAGADVEGWIRRKLGKGFGREEAAAFILGDGIKKPRGILTYPSGSVRGKIKQINSGHASQITGDGIIQLSGELKDEYAHNAQWLMKRSTTTAVMTLKDGTGQYMWLQGNIKEGRPQTLLGNEVRTADHMPAVAANALAIAFGNFEEGYTVVDRKGITILRDPYTKKGFVKFYATRRVGGDVSNHDAIKLLKIKA